MPKFASVYCSQCGREFGPGDHGFSACTEHNTDDREIISRLRSWADSYDEDLTTATQEWERIAWTEAARFLRLAATRMEALTNRSA